MDVYLKDGIYSWLQKGNLVDKINNISPKDFTLLKGDFKTLDVRKKSETKSNMRRQRNNVLRTCP